MRYQTIENFREYYNEWKASKQNIREYCKANGFNVFQFYYWKKKIEQSNMSASGKFIPVQMSQVGSGKIQITSSQSNIVSEKTPVS